MLNFLAQYQYFFIAFFTLVINIILALKGSNFITFVVLNLALILILELIGLNAFNMITEVINLFIDTISKILDKLFEPIRNFFDGFNIFKIF